MPSRNAQVGHSGFDIEWSKSGNPTFEDEEEEDGRDAVEARYIDKQDSQGCLRHMFCGQGCFFRNFLLVFILVGGSIGLLIVYTGGGDPRVFFTQEDPPGYTESNRWNNDQTPGRLELMITNSCEERWTPAFDRYIEAWRNTGGSASVLQLSTSRLPHNRDCPEYRGRMNVCNGDYGDTDWRGINIAMLFNGFIISSVAKLNDFHLDRESEDQRLYTMCHEIGHGFGLPHTDEEYFNRDRGDCMDYTTRPRNNLAPGQFNFDLLHQLYGIQGQDDILATPQDPLQPTRPQRPLEEDEEEEDDDDRRRWQRLRRLQDEMPNNVYSKYLNAREVIEAHVGGTKEIIASHNVTATQSGHHGEVYRVDLGSGYSMVVDKLLDTSRWVN